MEIRRLSDLFWKVSPNTFFLSIVLGVGTGLCYSLMIPFLMYSLSTKVDDDIAPGVSFSYFFSPTGGLALAFLTACFLIILMKGLSTSMSMYVSNRSSVEHRLYLYRRIQKMNLADLERIGQARLVNLLKIDIPAITAAAILLPQMWISMVTVVGVLGYLVYMNAKVFVVVACCLFVAVISYQMPLIFASRFLKRAREAHDEVQQGINGMIYGAKELALNRLKSDEFYRSALLKPEQAALGDSLKGATVFVFAQCYGEILSFLVVSLVVFHLRYAYSMNAGELLGLTMALLYLAGPVGVILNTASGIGQGRISLKKIQAFYRELAADTAPFDSGASQAVDVMAVDVMAVRNLGYTYQAEGENFSLRDVNLQFERAQISFIVGGNGSGKSTLGKCLSLHYIPTSGGLYFDDNEINDCNRAAARQNVSAVFSDYYLFKKLYSEAGPAARAEAVKYLNYLELDKKVSLSEDEFNTILLSDGQRKRLALLVLLMENRDICIFDEWAADQDPRFKEIFYSVILRDLKLKNKIVIVISHDDRYFDFADQIISMEGGEISKISFRDGGFSAHAGSWHRAPQVRQLV